MAVQPDVNNAVFGYFVSSEPVEIIEYIIRVTETQQISFVFLLHASAVFIKDGQEQELHLRSLGSIIIDPQMSEDVIRDLIGNCIELCFEPEMYDDVAGSGFSIIPGTYRFWFKVYPCQPNVGAHPTSQNASDPGIIDDEDEDFDPDEGRVRKWNYFLYAIVEYHARADKQKIPRDRFKKYRFLENYNLLLNLGYPLGDFEMDVNMQDLAAYHNSLGTLNIRVFSMRGNLLYAKKYEPENEEFIDMYLNSANRFALILNLYALFKKKHDRFFCMNCLKWVAKNSHTCGKVFKTSRRDQVDLPTLPEFRHQLIAYADFESYIKENKVHNISGWGCCLIEGDGNLFDSHYENLLTNNKLIESFVVYLSNQCIEYSSAGGNTDNCGLCGEPVVPGGGDVVIGKNFINGFEGSHHYACWDSPNNVMYCFFHNFRGYDSHFLIKDLVANCNVTRLSATNMEKFNVIQIEGWQTS